MNRLSELVALAESGQDVVTTWRSKIVARLIAAKPTERESQLVVVTDAFRQQRRKRVQITLYGGLKQIARASMQRMLTFIRCHFADVIPARTPTM